METKTLPSISIWRVLSYAQRIERFRKLRDLRYADFDSGFTGNNKSKAHCRVCFVELDRGEGIGYNEFMADGYRFQERYVCAFCQDVTV